MREKKSPRSGLMKADRVVFKLSKYCSYAGGVAVVMVMLVAVIDVVLAKFFKMSFPSATEWITYLNVLIVFAPLAYVELARGHTRVDLLGEKSPPAVSKIIRIFALLLSAVVFGYLTYCGVKLVRNQFITGTSSSSDAFAKLAFDLWIFGVIYTLGCALATLSFLWALLREFTGIGAHQPDKHDDGAQSGSGGEEA